jgi:hypothetical protein
MAVASYSKVLLSSSNSGSNIFVTSSAVLTAIHVTLALTSSIDEVYIYGCNNQSTASATLTLYWGNTGSIDKNNFVLSPLSGRTLLVDGKLLQAGLAISASIDSGSVLIDGFVNRINQP